MATRRQPWRPRQLVRVCGFQAGQPFTVETVTPLFPAEDLTDTSLDRLRSAWSAGVLGGFNYVSTTLGGITSRFGRFSTSGRVRLASLAKPTRVVPGDTYKTGLNGFRTAGSNNLRAGVTWTFSDGTTSDQLLVNVLGTEPLNTWVGQVGQTEVPADAVGVTPWVESPGGWHIDLGAGNSELVSRTVSDVGRLTIRRGRESADQASPPATLSGVIPLSGAIPVESGALVRVELGPEGGNPDSAVRFVGQVTDPKLRLAKGLPILEVVASSPSARLARIEIGDEPWPAEASDTRAERILDLAAAQDPHLNVVGNIGIGETVIARDVDRQDAIQLLDELAESTGGNLREGRDGQLLWRPARLAYPWGNVEGEGYGRAEFVLPSWAYSVPLELEQTVAWNSVAVYYGTANPQAYVQLQDAQAIVDRGLQHRKITTQLATASDATALARRVLAQGARPSWHIGSVAVDLLAILERDATLAGHLLAMETGAAIALADLPQDVPPLPGDGVFVVEGWTETIGAGTWRLELQLVDITRLALPATYADYGNLWRGTPPTYADMPLDLTYLAAGAWEPR